MNLFRIKNNTWDKIQDKFSSQYIENPDTFTVLKNKYEHIKRNVKKQYVDENNI